jgi:hypothetical protein
MKTLLRLFKIASMLVVCLIMTNLMQVNAQTVVTVDEGFNTLYDAVVANPGATLMLKRGGSYVIDQAVVINQPTIIMGEAGPVETAPAVVSFYADPGLAGGNNLFKAGADLTLKNIGVDGFTFDEQQIGPAIAVTKQGVSVLVDSCVFQKTDWILSTNGNNALNITLQNTTFFNLCHVGWDNYGGYGSLWGGDTTVYKSFNNTFVHSGRIFGCAYIGPHTLEQMEHNTYVNVWGELYYPSISDNFVVKNNIMFNPDVRGFIGKRVYRDANGDTLTTWAGDFSDFTSSNPRDSLQGDVGLFPSVDPLTDNSARNVVVSNNLRFTDAIVRANQAAVGATLQPLMNDSVKITFEKYGWLAENNINDLEGNSVDPQFASGAFPEDFYTIMKKEREQRHRVDLQEEGFPFTLAWLPGDATLATFQWPLPFDLKPTNQTIWDKGSDGYPLGDLRWFGPEVVAAWYAGEPCPQLIESGINDVRQSFGLRNYPNPATSSTTISYTLQKGDKVTLKVYNTVGAEISTLVNSTQSAGAHQVEFNTSNLSSGLYFYKLQAGDHSEMQKMMVKK